METTPTERLAKLRKAMDNKGLNACIIPTSDPHQSEYTADCWKFRNILSGFTGSAGTLIVGKSKAGLWTDSRYFLQAGEELTGSGIQLFRQGQPDCPRPEQWMLQEGYDKIGLDGSLFSVREVQNLFGFFPQSKQPLDTGFKPYTEVWPDRPALPSGKINLFAEAFHGEKLENKLKRLRQELRNQDADAMPITALDEIAWLLNLRGQDIAFNPVGICYAYINQEQCWLFAEENKLPDETLDYLQENRVLILEYHQFGLFLNKQEHQKILVDLSKINYELYKSLPKTAILLEAPSPITGMKALKNEVEIEGFRKAMIKDGVALTRFWMWAEKQLNSGNDSNEWLLGEKIAEYRQNQPNYLCESFAPIVGFNEHGAVVHYEATEETAFSVQKEGFLLIDTGAHFLEGTTDITRSWSLHKEVPIGYREDYTSLLKGLIALSSACFPTGTRGAQLDVLARQYLWKRSLNYGHGTGHGVGHVLNVHEGPQSIRMNENPTLLEPGMILSNEPGLYRTGQYGLRLENLLLVREKEVSDFGSYLSFETLTLFPFEINCMQTDQMTGEELEWINAYHRKVFDLLSPSLNSEERDWLKTKTRKIEYTPL